MDVGHYLTRIAYAGEVLPTLDVLKALQEAHLLSVPFENLDIHMGRSIVLDPARLFSKIVVMRRGGFCYELNGLFHLLLREIGFRAWLAMGRVYDRALAVYGPEFDHMLVLVEVDGDTWLADVGFGDFSMHPLKFMLDVPLIDANGTFLIERYDDGYFRVSRFSPEENRYVPEYLFSAGVRSLPDFRDMCLHHQTSPDSHFTRQRVCSIATARGRTTLTDTKLCVTAQGVRTEVVIRDEREFRRALAEHFNIVL